MSSLKPSGRSCRAEILLLLRVQPTRTQALKAERATCRLSWIATSASSTRRWTPCRCCQLASSLNRYVRRDLKDGKPTGLTMNAVASLSIVMKSTDILWQAHSVFQDVDLRRLADVQLNVSGSIGPLSMDDSWYLTPPTADTVGRTGNSKSTHQRQARPCPPAAA
jgi:hypothetical protein